MDARSALRKALQCAEHGTLLHEADLADLVAAWEPFAQRSARYRSCLPLNHIKTFLQRPLSPRLAAQLASLGRARASKAGPPELYEFEVVWMKAMATVCAAQLLSQKRCQIEDGSAHNPRAVVVSAHRVMMHGLQHFPSIAAVQLLSARYFALHSAAAVVPRSAFAAHSAMHSTAYRHLMRAVVECMVAAPKDTFRIDGTVHDVLNVPNDVGEVLQSQGPMPPPPPAAELHSKAMAALLLPTSEGGPSAEESWRLLQRQEEEDGNNGKKEASDNNNNQFAASRTPCTAHNEGSRWAAQLLFPFLANYLHSSVERFPRNVSSFYCFLPLLSDVVTFLSNFDVPPFTNTGSAHSPIVLPTPTALSPNPPGDYLYALCRLTMLVGIAKDKVVATIERICHTATANYGDGGEKVDGISPSGALLTILCSALQPLFAVLWQLPAQSVVQRSLHVSLAAGAVSLARGIIVAAAEAQGAGKPPNSAVSPEKRRFYIAIAAQDVALLRRFVSYHPRLRDEVRVALQRLPFFR